jgi:hypothetical protein
MPKKRDVHALAKRKLRQMLHDQLDAMLNGDTEEEGHRVTVLDSMLVRAYEGYGFNVSVDSQHPDQLIKADNRPRTVAQGAQVGLVRP